jgi:glyoxylase-like metal-dependent hydrolase (beta-lactamase superfamily II)
MSIHWGDVEVVLQHRPGPTPGSIWVAIPEKRAVFVGDTVMLNQPPFLADANIDAWVQSLDVLMDRYRGFAIVSGRGGLIELDDLRRQKRFLQKVTKKLEGLEKRNADPESVEKLVKPLVQEFNPGSDLQEQYTRRLYHGLFHYYLRSNRAPDELDQGLTNAE